MKDIPTPDELDAAIANAREEDEVRSVEGAVAAAYPCPRQCTQCDGDGSHHWMPDCDDAGEPLMVCKHCPAWREMTDKDLDDAE